MRFAFVNVQSGAGTTKGYFHYYRTFLRRGNKSLRACAEFLKQERIEVASLVEVDAGSSRTRHVNQLSLLSRLSGLRHQRFFPAFRLFERINQGNALLSRHKILSSENHDLPGSAEPRKISECRIQCGTDITIFTTHLSLNKSFRESQITKILDLITSSEGPVILAGDFNVSDEDELKLLKESKLQHAISLPTYPSWNPAKPLDHVFVSEHFLIKNAYVYNQKRFSDHLPLVVEVHLKELTS